MQNNIKGAFGVHIEAFREIWVVEFRFERPPGEQPIPVSLTAQEFSSGRSVRCEGDQLRQTTPPYDLSEKTLFVAYDAPAALGCHLSLGWPLPRHVLDLRGEFRRLTSGLDLPHDRELEDALAHFGLRPEEGLPGLLRAMLPDLDLPRAVQLRGRYAAAVARMEALGPPSTSYSTTGCGTAGSG
jgi:hypothetical protein